MLGVAKALAGNPRRLNDEALDTRGKGLGEMDWQELGDTTMNPQTRSLLQVSVEKAAIADEISLIRVIVCVIASITLTALVVVFWTSAIWALISSVAFEVWVARLLTSEATTANPARPIVSIAQSKIVRSLEQTLCRCSHRDRSNRQSVWR